MKQAELLNMKLNYLVKGLGVVKAENQENSIRCSGKLSSWEITERYESMKVWTYKSVKVWKYECKKVWMYESMKVWKYESMKV